MVNLSKRMHKLMPQLWRVKGGAGAAILPPKAPAPQLKSVTLRLPGSANAFDHGAYSFWRKFLPAFRYHNLTIPITVEQRRDAPLSDAPTLTLNFEATTQEALVKQNTHPRYSDEESLQRWVQQLEDKRKAQKLAELRGGPVATYDKDGWVEKLRQQQQEVGIPQAHRTTIGAISLKPQPAADPSQPSTTSPPTTIYQRSITLGLRGRQALDIWRWFQGVTQARPYKLNREERSAKLNHAIYAEQAEEDRQRVKAGLDAMKKEQEELKRAKEAALKLSEV